VFDFDYMYTTDLLEPTRPDEKQLGRVKRHFINTEVQLGNLEWREISRYEVSLKASRNGRGVPLLEDIPVVGLAFRPLPQAKKSIQKNVIVGQAAIYPTIEDLLGLRPGATSRVDTGQVGREINQLLTKGRNSAEMVESLLEMKVNQTLQTTCPTLCTPASSGDAGAAAIGPPRTRTYLPVRAEQPNLIPMLRDPSTASRASRGPIQNQFPPTKSGIEQTGYWKPAGSAPANATPSRRRQVLR
jgi:hypothetical protein